MKKTTLIAVGAFAVLLAVVLATRETEVNEGVQKLSLPPLKGDVTAIDFTGPTPAKLVAENGQWKVNGFAADDAQVKGLTDALKDFRAADFVTEKTEKHAEYEVDDVKGTKMALTTATGPAWVLVFGKAAKSGGTYVREAKSNAVFTTQSPVAFHVKKGVSGWRKKGIATAPASEMMKVTVTQADGVLGLQRGADGKLELVPAPPAGFRFDESAAQRLVQQLSALTAQDFADSLGAQVATVDVELKGGKQLAMKIGAKQGDTVPFSIDKDPQVYLLPAYATEAVLKKPEDLRELTLLGAFEPEKVTRVAISAGGKSTVLVKDAAGWKVVEPKTPPAGFELDPAMVQQQLQRFRALRGTKAVTGVSDAAAGFSKPSASVELTLEGGARQAFKLGSETPQKELYAKGSADALVYAVGAHEKQQLEQGVELFKKRPPPDMSQIRGLEQLPPDVRRQLEAQLRQRGN